MNCLSTVVAFCVLHNFAFGSNEDYINENPVLNEKQRQYEENAGSKADLMENKHYYYPNYYKDLNRRFVPVYPYEEIPKTLNGNDALANLKELLQAVQTKTANNEDAKLIPVRAPPELVLAVARESAKLKNPKPSYPTEEALKNSALRSGDYWNGVWKEEVDPVQHLRTGHEKTPASQKMALPSLTRSSGTSRFTNYANTQAEEDAFDVGAIRTGKRSGIAASVANLAKGALGGGVLSGHVAYMKSGYVSAICLNCFFGFYLATCFYLLVKSSQILCKRCHMSYMTYPDLAEAALSLSRNKSMNKIANCYRHFIEFIICLNLYGSCACYQLIIAKTIKQLVENTDRSDVAGLNGMPSLRVYVAIIILPVIAITLITQLKYLAPFSMLANAFVAFCVIMAIHYARENNPHFVGMSPFNGLYNQVIYIGMGVFSMSSAGVVLPVENNMKDPKKFGFVLFCGYVLIITSVFLCSFFGYVGYLENCRSPITINFPMTTFPMILKGCIAAMIYVTHALNFYMPFQTCFVYLKRFHKPEEWFKWELIYRALISFIISVVAIIFPSIDALMGFLGCFCLSNMAFIGPNFIYTVVIWDRPGLGVYKWRLLRAIIFATIGICILVCGTIVASVEMVETFIKSTINIESSDVSNVGLAETAAETTPLLY